MPMIANLTKRFVALSDVPVLPQMPRRCGRRIHPSTIYRWAIRGVRGVRLEAVRVGVTVCTTEGALQRYFTRLAAVGHSLPATPTAFPAGDAGSSVERL